MPVKLQLEQDKFWDPKVIEFVCNVEDKWTKIGHVISEMKYMTPSLRIQLYL